MTENLWRDDFPAIVNHPEMIFFDNAATTQKPAVVIKIMIDLWEKGITAVGRSSGILAREQWQLLERSQENIARFFGAKIDELIITKSATEALNLVAENFCNLVDEEEKIILGINNHHSNLAPWLIRKKSQIIWAPLTESGLLDQKKLKKILLDEKVRVVSLTWTSNVFGERENLAAVEELLEKMNEKRQRQIFLIIDAAASVSEIKINWRKIKASAMIVSGHKMYGPAIAGVLVRKELLLNGNFAPVFYGGGMLKSLTLAKEITLAENQSQRWRAGVTDLVGIVGWSAACDWLSQDQEKKEQYLRELTAYLVTELQKIKTIRILGEATREHGHLVSFVMPSFKTVDIMAYLASQNVLAREGFHCCQPLHESLGLAGSIRLSLAIYNTKKEIDQVVSLLNKIPQVLWKSDDII